MPLDSNDALKAIELLELYRSRLSDKTDKNLIDAIEKVIDVFNSQFFIALLGHSRFFQIVVFKEIQQFYTEILSNEYLSISDKTKETLNLLNNLKICPSSPSSFARNSRIGSRLANDIDSVNLMYLSSKRNAQMTNSSNFGYSTLPNNLHLSDQSENAENESLSCDTNNSLGNETELNHIDKYLIDRPIVMEAVILKGSKGFGFSVAGGIDNPYLHQNDPGIYVTKITPGGPVDVNGSLCINDQILSVNGINMTYLTHEAAVGTLREAGDRLNLVIQRDPNIKRRMFALDYMRKDRKSSSKSDSNDVSQPNQSYSQGALNSNHRTSSNNSLFVTSKSSSTASNVNHCGKPAVPVKSPKPRIITVSLYKGERGLGFSIGGGKGNEHYPNDSGIYITKISENGIAAKSGLISEGDKLIQVNEYLMTDISHEDAVNILCNVGSKVEMKLLKPPTFSNHVIMDIENEVGSACQSTKAPSEINSSDGNSINPNNSELNPDSVFEDIDLARKSPRLVILERADLSKSLGFNIVGGEDEDGIFVSYIIPKGLADQSKNLFVGDRIWRVNGDDISCATHDEAATLLKGAGRKVELLVTTDIEEYLAFESKYTNWSALKNPDISNHRSNSKSTPNLAENVDNKTYNKYVPSNKLVNKSDEHVRSVGNELNKRHNRNREKNDDLRSSGMYKSIDLLSDDQCSNFDYPESIRKTDSRASEKENLMISSKEGNNLSINTSFNHSNHSTESVGNLDKNIDQKQNGFYVRATFDFDPDIEKNVPSRPLAFLTNDIIFVVNSNDQDWWQARIVEDNCENGPLGIIPGPIRLYRKERKQKKKVNFDSQLVSKNSKKQGKSSFLKRNSSVAKSTTSLNDLKSDKVDLFDEKIDPASIMQLFYEPLVKITLDYIRPVVIIGPLREKINDKLIADHPNLFSSCVPHTTRGRRPYEENGKDYYFVVNKKEMEDDIKHQKFIEAGQYKGNLYGTSVQAVKDVARTKHCVLDVSALAIKRLVAANLLPITILIKPPSVKALCNLSNKISVAQADKEVKKTDEIHSKLSHYFTAVVWEDEFNALYRTIKSIIQSNSGTDIWVPKNQNILIL